MCQYTYRDDTKYGLVPALRKLTIFCWRNIRHHLQFAAQQILQALQYSHSSGNTRSKGTEATWNKQLLISNHQSAKSVMGRISYKNEQIQQ